MTNLSDLGLITQAVVLGQDRAFERLVARYQGRVRRFLLSLSGGNQADSDDQAQETFIRAWQGLKHFQGLSQFDTWLYRIAYRVHLDWYRTEAKHPATSLDTLGDGHNSAAKPPATDVAYAPPDTALRMDLHTALKQVSHNERTCLVLQLIEGRDLQQIASITGMNVNTVKSHLARGKRIMAQFLRQHGYSA